MPYFPAVGHIDDNLSPQEVMKEYRRRYSLAAYYRRRDALVEKLGGKCAVCLSTEGLCFIRKKSAPEFRVGQLVNMNAKRRDALLKHCTLMCSAHAAEKLHHKGRLTHGTYWAAYKKKCRCDECLEYMANLALQRREDRRYKKAVFQGVA